MKIGTTTLEELKAAVNDATKLFSESKVAEFDKITDSRRLLDDLLSDNIHAIVAALEVGEKLRELIGQYATNPTIDIALDNYDKVTR
jgi:hypothetical protein